MFHYIDVIIFFNIVYGFYYPVVAGSPKSSQKPIANRFILCDPVATLKNNHWVKMQLGELEKQVMQYLWTVDGAGAKQVHGIFAKARGGSLNTIQSTLDRLYKKKLLTRHKEGHAFIYHAAVERNDLIAQLIHSVTDDFVEAGEHSVVAAFSSVSSQLDESELDELEQMIERQRQLRKRGQS